LWLNENACFNYVVPYGIRTFVHTDNRSYANFDKAYIRSNIVFNKPDNIILTARTFVPMLLRNFLFCGKKSIVLCVYAIKVVVVVFVIWQSGHWFLQVNAKLNKKAIFRAKLIFFDKPIQLTNLVYSKPIQNKPADMILID
jgi:hypothetical protein